MSSMSASDAISAARERLREQPWGLAMAVIADGETRIDIDQGKDSFVEDSYFQIGSITKTITGLLVADAVQQGEADLGTTVGSILGEAAGNCYDITLLDLATQHSGLPRLPPNMGDDVDPKDPYAAYTEDDLLAALRVAEPSDGSYGYSNFGFMLLGHLLGRIARQPYPALVTERIFGPLGMSAFCGVPTQSRLEGDSGPAQTPWWTTQLPGAGGIACSIADLARYLQAHLTPPQDLKVPIDMVLDQHADGPPAMGLGWVHQGGGHWHNGGTGGFRSFAALHRGTGTAIALLVNSHDVDVLDRVGFATLTELVRSRVC